MYTVYINDQIAYWEIPEQELKDIIFELVETNYGKPVKITWRRDN